MLLVIFYCFSGQLLAQGLYSAVGSRDLLVCRAQGCDVYTGALNPGPYILSEGQGATETSQSLNPKTPKPETLNPKCL